MPDIISIAWHPDRTVPTEDSAVLWVDMSDNAQLVVRSDTDVSSMPDLVQQLKPILFPQS